MVCTAFGGALLNPLAAQLRTLARQAQQSFQHTERIIATGAGHEVITRNGARNSQS